MSDHTSTAGTRPDPGAQQAHGSSLDSIYPNAHDTLGTRAELPAVLFPPCSLAVPHLLPPRLTVWAGRPKLGKSWLVLQLAGKLL